MKPKITPRQRMFVEAYAGNATEAAKAAGYSDKSAKMQGSRLMTNEHIREAIKRREDRIAGKHIMKLAEAQSLLSDTARDENKRDEVRLKAVDSLSRISGWNKHKLEVTGELGILDLVRESYDQKPTEKPAPPAPVEE